MMTAYQAMEAAWALGRSVQAELRGAGRPEPARLPHEERTGVPPVVRQRTLHTDWAALTKVAIRLARLAGQSSAGPPRNIIKYWQEEDLAQAVWGGPWQRCLEAFTVFGMVLLHQAERRRTSMNLMLLFAHRLLPTAFSAGCAQSVATQGCKQARQQEALPRVCALETQITTQPETAWREAKR